jgi:uncharacterized protein (DUF58 family)
MQGLRNRFSLFLPNTFFLLPGGLFLLFALSYRYEALLPVAKMLSIAGGSLLLADAIVLFLPARPLHAIRKTSAHWGLADPNRVRITFRNRTLMPLRMLVVDEIPVELQIRDFQRSFRVDAGKEDTLVYTLTPLSRGNYSFGHVQVFLDSPLRLLRRRLTLGEPCSVKVYPSILQMKHYSLLSLPHIATHHGIRKMRRIGHSYEFEQIKDYVQGDDIRSINWKATGRRGGQLMVNQYEDERAQPIYNLIDKSRAMHMPFEGLSLLDYAINTSLVIANVSIQKHDKAGLLTYSDKLGGFLPADRKSGQMGLILEMLYSQKPRQTESDPELLYNAVKRLIRGRSLLFLYTNFESMHSLERALPVLRRLNLQHLLVPIFFENRELTDYAYGEAEGEEDMFTRTIAQQFVQDKRQIAGTLSAYGIQSILTPPDKLSIAVLNKYLELKARGAI